jgi:hypothetical protein
VLADSWRCCSLCPAASDLLPFHIADPLTSRDSGGEYGSTGYPGNMTDAGSLGQSGGAAGPSGFDAGAIGGPTPSSGDFSQSAPSRFVPPSGHRVADHETPLFSSSDNSYGNTGYPGDQSDLSGTQNSGAGTSGSGQAGFVDRARGGIEQAAGRVTGNEDLAQRGQQRTQGNF